MAASKAIIAVTTNSSMSVNAFIARPEIPSYNDLLQFLGLKQRASLYELMPKPCLRFAFATAKENHVLTNRSQRPMTYNENTFFAAWTPRLLGVLRIVTGFLFAAHGSQKLLGFP